MGEELPYPNASFDVVVCVDVLEHVTDFSRVLAETACVLRPNGLFIFDTINRNILAKFMTITVAEDIWGLLPKGTHDQALFIKPAELKESLLKASLAPGAMTGLWPRCIDRRGDILFGRLPTTAIIYMGTARKK